MDTRMVAAAHVARAALENNRSDRLLRLFDFLLDQTMAGQSPSEQQIAGEVFDRDGVGGSGRDANVRVYVHRLRKILAAAFADSEGDRLQIPVGEYRLQLLGDDPPPEASALGEPKPTARRWRLRPRPVARVAACLLLVGAIGVGAWLHSGEQNELEQTLAWNAIGTGERPVTVVIGDYYLFAKTGDGGPSAARRGPRLVWDRTVPTREDLTVYQILNPEAAPTVLDYNQQFVSSGTITALSDLRSALAQLPSLQGRRVRLIASSQLTPEVLTASNLIYIGLFSGMNVLLRDPLLQASGFKADMEQDGLIDGASGTRYDGDGMILADERIARRDYGYLASLPGPAGNRILVIAGLGDAALKEVAELAGDPVVLQSIGSDRVRQEQGFEALFRVRTVRNVNVGANLVVNRPLKTAGIWDDSSQVPVYRPVSVEKPAQQMP